MKAVVRRPGRLVCEEVPEPTPGAGQVLVKTLCCGICGSDLHALHAFEHMTELSARSGAAMSVDPAEDIVFGHEFCAELLDFGPDTPKRFRPGQRVTALPVAFGPQGFETVGYSNRYPGGFGERMVLTEAMLLPIPEHLTDQQAAMTEPFAVGEHAVAVSAAGPDAVALVIGCGPVGLAVIAALKARGLGPVIAADFSPARRRVAEILGADVVLDPAVSSPYARWAEFDVPATMAERSVAQMAGRPGKRAVIFECVGVPGVLQAIIEGAPPTAQVLVAGVCMAPDRIEPFLCINKQLELKFVLGYTPDEFAGTLDHIAAGRIDVRPAITDSVGLDGVADAFAALADPEKQCKVVVDPRL